MPKSNGLTPKQAMFVKEYISDFNGSRAATAAGYSEKTARSIATELLTKPYIREEVDAAIEERVKVLTLTQDRILCGINDLATDDEHPGSVRVRAYELLGKHFGMFTDKVQHSGAVDLGGGKPFQVVVVDPAELDAGE